MKCIFCRTEEPRADKKASAILCSVCTQKLTGSPAGIGKVPAGQAVEKPAKVVKSKKAKKAKSAAPKKTAGKKTVGLGRGWHLKKHFVAPDGTTYSFGKPV